jgi:hypothetical protein
VLRLLFVSRQAEGACVFSSFSGKPKAPALDRAAQDSRAGSDVWRRILRCSTQARSACR